MERGRPYLMKQKLHNLYLSVKMMWHMLNPIFRALVIIFIITSSLILILAPNRNMWAGICAGSFLLAALSGVAIYLLLKEIK